MDIGELLVNIRLKTESLEKGLNEIKSQLSKSDQEVKKNAASYGALAFVAENAFSRMVRVIKSGVDAFSQYNNSMVGLRSIVQGTGNDFGKAQSFIDSFTKDGLVPASNAATALKNLLSRGFGMDEAADILNRLKDSAAFGRQASLSLGEAVQSASEGLKNENSILVDNAGVTKNVAKMWEDYAKTLGKTVNDLSLAEKRQAEYSGIMKETAYQVGDAAKYANEFSGSQSKAAAETLKLKQALGSGVTPILSQMLTLITPLISGLTQWIENNKALVGTVAVVSTALLGIITVITAVNAAVAILGPAVLSLKVAFAGLLANPVVLALTAVATGIAIIYTQTQKAKKEQEAYNASLEKFNKIKSDGISKSQVPELQEEITTMQKLISEKDRLTEAQKRFEEEQDKINNGTMQWTETMGNRAHIWDDIESGLKKVNAGFKNLHVSYDQAKERVEVYSSAVKEANRVSLDEFNTEAKTIAQKHTAVLEIESLIRAYKNAQVGSNEYYTVQKKLADIFPQFASNSGIAIDAIQNVVNAQDAAAKAEFQIMQARAKTQRIDLENRLRADELIVQSLKAVNEAQTSSDVGVKNFLVGNLSQAEEKLAALRSEVEGLRNLENINIDQVTGVKPPDYSTEIQTQNQAYQNKALEDALKLYEHRKYMNQLTLEDEVRTLESIYNTYAHTTEEKMELEEKLYSARQAIRDRDAKAIEDSIAAQEKLLQEKDQDFVRQIDRKKLYNQINGDDEIKQYQALIQYHKDYLDKILADERISVDEKNRIRRQETQTIEDTEDKIYNIRKTYIEKAVNEYISAKQKQYDQEEALENDRLNKKLAALDKEYSDKEKDMKAAERTAELESLYDEERKFANAATKEGQERLKEIRSQIAALNKQAEQERLEAEKEAKKEGIEAEIEANKEKYKALRDELEAAQKEMLAAASNFAKESAQVMANANQSIADQLYGIFQTFDIQTNNLMTRGLIKLRTMADAYKVNLSDLIINPGNLSFGTIGSGSFGNTTNNVTINDYGDKIMQDKEEVVDYTKELFNSARDAIRANGGSI